MSVALLSHIIGRGKADIILDTSTKRSAHKGVETVDGSPYAYDST